jgi:hypothetical protein
MLFAPLPFFPEVFPEAPGGPITSFAGIEDAGLSVSVPDPTSEEHPIQTNELPMNKQIMNLTNSGDDRRLGSI